MISSFKFKSSTKTDPFNFPWITWMSVSKTFSLDALSSSNWFHSIIYVLYFKCCFFQLFDQESQDFLKF